MTPTSAQITSLTRRVDELDWDTNRRRPRRGRHRGHRQDSHRGRVPAASARSTTKQSGSARPSTWPAIASGKGSTATSRTRCQLSWPNCELRSGRTCSRSHVSWAARLEQPDPWPDDFDAWIAQCHAAGQTRPTPLMLRYQPGDWNALHRDLYGELVFPLQVVIGLDSPVDDYSGGEFVVVEQRPRAQSRATTLTIPRGHGVVFTTRDRPIRSSRGWTAAPMRHGVSTLHTGLRRTLGLVFHDAK